MAQMSTTGTGVQDIVAAADAVVAAVNEQDLAQWKALKNPPEGDEQEEKKKEMEAAEAALTDALHKKANVLLELDQVCQKYRAIMHGTRRIRVLYRHSTAHILHAVRRYQHAWYK